MLEGVRIMNCYQTNAVACGCIVGEDLITNATTGGFFSAGIIVDESSLNQWDALFTKYTTYLAQDAELFKETMPMTNEFYARWFVDRTAVTAQPLISPDGRTWLDDVPQSFAAGNVTSIDTIGFGLTNLGVGTDLIVASEMFRVDLTTNPFFEVGAFLT